MDEAKLHVEATEELNCGGRQMFSSEALGPLGGSIERLGLQLLERLLIGPQQPNVLISPFSLSLALAQLALGPPAASLTVSPVALHLPSYCLCPVLLWSGLYGFPCPV